MLAQGRRQAGTPVDDREQRPPDLALDQAANHIAPRGGAFIASQTNVEHHALAIRAHAERNQHRHPNTALANADFRVPAIHQQILNLVLGEIAPTPRLEIVREAAHQARHRVLRQRSATQQRRQGALDPPRIGATEVDPENRFIDALASTLIAGHQLAAPFRGFAVSAPDASPRHREGRRPQTGGQRPIASPVSIAEPCGTHAHRGRRAQRGLQFLFHDGVN